jgi:hypothetical protein
MLGSLNICSIRGGEGEMGPYERPIGAFKGHRIDPLSKEATMKLSMKVASTLAVLALGLVPATGVAAGPNYAPEHPTHPTHPSTPKGNAYGKYCQGKSKKHVKGEKGTEFSRCVRTMKQADNQDLTPKQACKDESKEHVKGEKGTAYSRCVKAVAQMKKDKAEEEDSTTQS